MADALYELGHDVMSCDLNYPSQSKHGVPHYQGDCRDILYDGWAQAQIAFPECKYLCNSGVKHLYQGKRRWNPDGSENPICAERWQKMLEAAAFFEELWNAPVGLNVLENSQMHGHAIRALGGLKSTQIVRPNWFGVKETKAACLYIRGTKKRMRATNLIEKPKDPTPEEKREWERCFRMAPDKPGEEGRRSKLRARTQPEVAAAIANQLIGDARLREAA